MSKALAEKITGLLGPQTPLWACELTSQHLIVAGVSKHRDRIVVKSASEIPAGVVIPSQTETNIKSPEATRSRLKDELSRVGFKGSEIVVVVPDDTARIAFLTADKTSKNVEEQQTFIRWKLKKTVPFDVDSAQVAYRVLGPHPSGHGINMLVALSPTSIVQEYENLFDSMQVHAGRVLPSTLATLNLFDPPADDGLLLKIAPDCITTTVFQDKRIQFYRRVADASLYDAVYPTVMYYQDKLGGKGINQLFVCGYDSDLRADLAEVQEKLGLQAHRLAPKTVDDIYKPALGAVHLSSEGVI